MYVSKKYDMFQNSNIDLKKVSKEKHYEHTTNI